VASSPYDAFIALLEREREAARRADIDALLQLQEAKRAAVEEIRKSDLPRDRLNHLAEKARANIWLLRHLVHCLQGAIGASDGQTYTADGRCSTVPNGISRGSV
jgi:hypothetical protein